jgi:curved DNA-binding protein CbpA
MRTACAESRVWQCSAPGQITGSSRRPQYFSQQQTTRTQRHWEASIERSNLFRHSYKTNGTSRITTRVANTDIQTSIAEETESDYYSILGVSPSATRLEIKKAYRNAMKDWHPDQSNDSETHEFAIFLNQIYETLMDDDSRAEYDVISGFSFTGTNPFVDRSYPLDFAFVDEFSCIGCRNCNNIAPKTYSMEEEHGRARVMKQGVDTVDKLQESIDSCPVSCIHWVSAPQLTMLEETMARMERINVWILMNGGGKGANLNVFGEASIAWEKRRAARLDREQQARWQWAPFGGAAGANVQAARRAAAAEAATGGGGAESSDPEDYDGSGQRTPRSSRRVDAAEMASAARKWRDYQRAKRQKRQKLLAEVGPE